MSVVRATVQGGKIVADAPADWPDGTAVEVRPSEGPFGTTEEEWDDSPEGVEAWAARVHALEPFLTEDEERAWQQALDAQKASEKATFFERAEALRRTWDDR